MCLPRIGRIVDIADGSASVDTENRLVAIELLCLPDAVIGDYVMYHSGYALAVLTEDDATERLRLTKQLSRNPER